MGDIKLLLEHAAKEILKAMKGIGTDEALLVRELYNVPPQFRKQLRERFKQLGGTGEQSIESWIKGDTSMGFETICLELTKTPHEMEADALRDAMAGWGTDNNILQRVFCLMPAMDMSRLQQAFKERHPEQKTLEECIKADVSAIFT